MKLSEARKLPASHQQAFVRVGRLIRPLGCLQRFDWSHPDGTCQKKTWDSSEALDKALAPLGGLSGDTYPKLHEIVVQAVIVLQKTQQMAPYVMNPGASMPNGTEQRVADLGRRSVSLSEMVDNAFTLDDPSWDADVPEDESKPEPAPRPAPPSAEKAPPAPPAPAPTAAPAAAPEHAEPVVASAPPPKPALSPTAQGLADGLHEVLALLQSGDHDPDRTATAVVKSRPMLAELDEKLKAYRDLPRPEADHAGATRFASEVDHALGQVRKAANELARAARQASTPTSENHAEDAFRDADELLERATTEVRTALQFMPAKG